MNKIDVYMYYEDKSVPDDELMCALVWKDNVYRFKYKHMGHIAKLYDVPEPVREYLLQWAQMLNNPD